MKPGRRYVAIATRYARDVVAGKIPACKWVRLACLRQLKDLDRAKSKKYPYRFDRAAAERACRFAELMPHTKGEWARKQEPIRLSPWQIFCRTTIFGWIRKKNGLRRFREVYIEVPRKNGKSTDAATTGLYMFAADGEFGAEVYSGAVSEKQAWEIFRPARLMAKRTPDLCDHYGIEVNAATLAIPDNGSRFEPLIGKPHDGASPSCALVDEYHEHQTDELYETMITGMGARQQPLAYIITTAGSNLAGPCHIKRDQVLKVLEGILKNDELFGIVYTIDEEDDWTSEEALRKANPNYNVSVDGEYLASRQRDAIQIASKQNAFKTKHLNIWVGARSVWMNMQSWAKCPPRKTLDELAGRPCYIALDLSSKIDLAAQMLVFPPDGDDLLWHVHGRYYLPEDVVLEKATGNFSHYDAWAKQGLLTLTDGDLIDYEEIENDLRDFKSRFQVEEVPYDPFQATQLATRMTAEGFTMVEMAPTAKNFSEPMKHLEALVKVRRLAHGKDPILTWMMSNVMLRPDRANRDLYYPVKEKPENKIDGAVALIMAIARAMTGEGGGSVYESRGFLTV